MRIQQVRGQWYLNGYAWDGEWVKVSNFNGAVEQVPNEVEFDVTCKLTGNFDTPIYSVFHTNTETELESVEEALNREGIPNRRMESDTAGEWRPNHFVVVRPEDVSKAANILSELHCIA